MDKILALLEQLGASDELAQSIVGAIEEKQTSIREEIDAEYKGKLAKAKEVCVAEVNEHKLELSRKLQLWMESKTDQIEQQIAKQAVVKESAAETRLREIVTLLEGVEANSEKADNADIQAALKQVKQLQESQKKAQNQIQTLTQQAKRSHGIAEAALAKNKQLVEENAKLKAQGSGQISESKKPSKVEGKAKDKPISESRKKPAKPVSTRKQEESQLPKKKGVVAESAPAKTRTMDGYDPNSIASHMD